MRKSRVIVTVVLLVAVVLPLAADTDMTRWENRLKAYYNELVLDVKATDDPTEKRDLLNESLSKTLRAIERVEALPGLSERQGQGMTQYRAAVQDKFDELNGLGGFQRVVDADLDGFADYMVQDIEQARTTVVMTGAGLLIIILILIILL